ncbi:MAG TPA: hypothetical protein VFS75_03400 [Candidatus Paceibacterota bacterium]|nr:hypothetical protein [Candidatus Paceibacterota bacterium]
MFESFKARREVLPSVEFANWKSADTELEALSAAVTSKMEWEEEDGGDNIQFTPQEGYDESLKNLQKYLDGKGLRYSTEALATALTETLGKGPEYIETVS